MHDYPNLSFLRARETVPGITQDRYLSAMPRHLSYSRRRPAPSSTSSPSVPVVSPAVPPVLAPLDYVRYQPAATPERLAARACSDPRVRRRRGLSTKADNEPECNSEKCWPSGLCDEDDRYVTFSLPEVDQCNDTETLIQLSFELDRRAKLVGELYHLMDSAEIAQRNKTRAQQLAHEADLRIDTARDVVANGGPTSAHFARSVQSRKSFQRQLGGANVALDASVQQGVLSGTFQLGIDPAKARKLPSYDDRGKLGVLHRIRALKGRSAANSSTPATPRSAGGASQYTESQNFAATQNAALPEVVVTKVEESSLPAMAPRSNSALRRQYSNGLRRFASAGGAFVKRVSSRSGTVGRSSLAVEAAAAACLDYSTLVKLKDDPEQMLLELELKANDARRELSDRQSAAADAEAALKKRTSIDQRRLAVLDRFYARLHGYESDPVAKKMLVEVADMSDSAIEAERDLWYKYSELEVMRYAFEDHSNGLAYVSEALSLLTAVVQELYTAKTTNYAELLRKGRSERLAATEAKTRLRAAKIGTSQALTKASLAAACCPDIPRIKEIAVASSEKLSSADSSHDNIGFDSIMYKAVVDAFSATQTSLVDCHEAVAWCKSRVAQIESDVAHGNRDLQRLEQDVIEERMALLQQRHEKKPNFFNELRNRDKRMLSPCSKTFAENRTTSRQSV